MKDRIFLTHPLDDLPVFATDLEIAEALVGKKQAAQWLKTGLPAIQKVPGFPKIDTFHGGRPVPLVREFYASFLGLSHYGPAMTDPHDEDKVWKTSKRGPKSMVEPRKG